MGVVGVRFRGFGNWTRIFETFGNLKFPEIAATCETSEEINFFDAFNNFVPEKNICLVKSWYIFKFNKYQKWNKKNILTILTRPES